MSSMLTPMPNALVATIIRCLSTIKSANMLALPTAS
jgi:hypothetical protein